MSHTSRILAVHPSDDRYGSDLMFVRTLHALADSNEITVVLPDRDGQLARQIATSGLRVRQCRTLVLQKNLLKSWRLLLLPYFATVSTLKCIKVIHEQKPDVVYINTITIPCWVLASRLSRVRVVVHARESEPQMPRVLRLMLYSPLVLAQRVICNSESTSRELCSVLRPLEGKTVTIYNGIEFPALNACARENRSNGSKLFVLVGRLSPRKGQDIAVNAFASLLNSGRIAPDAELHLVGDALPEYAWYVDKIHELAHRLRVERNIVFAGYHSDTSHYYQSADVCIVPSRVEPFGNVAAEALAQGVPTVVSDCGGLPEIVARTKSGFVFEGGSYEDLAQKLHRAVQFSESPGVQEACVQDSQYTRRRFAPDRYRREIVQALKVCARGIEESDG